MSLKVATPAAIMQGVVVAKMEKTIFGKAIKLKSAYCSLNGQAPESVKEPYANLYIQLKGCNANCKFCTFKCVAKDFNFDKFDKVLNELKSNVRINKISITGGEPTYDLGKLYRIADIVREKVPECFFVVNTNGYQLFDLYKYGKSELFDSISLSRHHYDDETNNDILGFNSISSRIIKVIQTLFWKQKDKLHLSCNLIKGYIDSEQEVYKYLEHASKLKIFDVGLVSLMKINDFCKNNFIDIYDLKLDKKNIFNTKTWNFENSCSCKNYLYIPEKGGNEAVKLYHRCFHLTHEVSNTLVFDGENLKIGFDGETLI